VSIPCIAGKILEVNLTNRKITEQPIPDEMIETYLGGRGVAAKILWDNTDKETDPLGPDNVLIFSTGTLTGTAPCSGRVTVTTKSPATGMYLKTSAGGHWGPKLKAAGYDFIVIKGKAKKPVYLFVNQDGVQFINADHLWGKDTRETTFAIQRELNDDSVEVSCIGPAGENKVLFAAVMFSIYCAAARGGAGAVMGAKNLKAIAVQGKAGFKPADREKFYQSVNNARELIMNDSSYGVLSEFGTSGILMGVNEMGIVATKSFREGPFAGAKYLTGQYLKEAGYLKKRLACDSCIIGCHRYTEWKDGHSGGPEYETLAALGCGLCISDTEAVLKGNELCNLYGLDTISTGGVIQWAVESFERGAITEQDTGGVPFNWGDGKLLIDLIEKIALRKGIGDLLAEGTKRASEKVGHDSWKWAVQARGLEQSRVDTRLAKSYALAFALNPRGSDHLTTECIAEFGSSLEGIARIEKITGREDLATPYTTEKRPEIVRWHEDCYAATDALGFCAFTTTLLYSFTPVEMAELFKYGTGIDMDEAKLMQAGERIVTLEQCYNIKMGKTRGWHVLPWRLMNEPPAVDQGSTNTQQELDGMLDRYFELRKWDKETSFPYLSTLASLGFEEIGKELQQSGVKLLP
jgi:aldehyde:ferredoxin oxidoreductase